MERYNDYELLYLFHCGSDEAKEILYHRYYKLVAKWVQPFLYHGRIHGWEFEDFIQIGMLAFFKAIDSYRDDKQTSLKTFMKGNILKRVISCVRQGHCIEEKINAIEFSLDNWLDEEEQYRYEDVVADPNEDYQPHASLIVKEQSTYYQERIYAVTSPREYQILLYKKASYEEEEIAKKLNITLRSVYNAVYRCSKKIEGIDEFE